MLYIPVTTLTKMSVLAFYLRLSVQRNFRRAVKVVMGLCAALVVAALVAQCTYCLPVIPAPPASSPRRPWRGEEPPWQQGQQQEGQLLRPGHCENPLLYYRLTGGLNVALGVVVLALPAPILWQVKMARQEKLAVVAIFSLSILSALHPPNTPLCLC